MNHSVVWTECGEHVLLTKYMFVILSDEHICLVQKHVFGPTYMFQCWCRHNYHHLNANMLCHMDMRYLKCNYCTYNTTGGRGRTIPELCQLSRIPTPHFGGWRGLRQMCSPLERYGCRILLGPVLRELRECDTKNTPQAVYSLCSIRVCPTRPFPCVLGIVRATPMVLLTIPCVCTVGGVLWGIC